MNPISINPVIFMEDRWVILNCFNIKPNMYIINDFGIIKNIISNKIISPMRGAYLTTQLMNYDGTRSTYLINRLVATVFVYNPDPATKIYVNHKDLYTWNNHFSNLEWVTPKENSVHASENNAYTTDYSTVFLNKGHFSDGAKTAGDKNGMARLTSDQVHFICKALEEGFNYSNALSIAGLEVNENNRFIVSHIAQGTKWKHISKLYKIPETKKFINYSNYIIKICELLQEGKRTGVIIKILNLPGTYEQCRGVIGRIRRRDAYTEISLNYNW